MGRKLIGDQSIHSNIFLILFGYYGGYDVGGKLSGDQLIRSNFTPTPDTWDTQSYNSLPHIKSKNMNIQF